MKKLTFLALLLLFSLGIKAQYQLSLEGTIKKPIYTIDATSEKLAAGKTISITGAYQRPNMLCYLATVDGKNMSIPADAVNNIDFAIPSKTKDLWDMVMLGTPVIQTLVSKNFQYDLREDLNQEAVEFVKYCSQNNLFYQDAYMEDYLQGLLASIHPITISDGRPGTLSIRILSDSDPDAFCAPNGTIFITTGMLSLFTTEDELAAILTHEVTHFVLDHPIIQMNIAAQRERRAEFWSGFATIMAATTEAVIATKHEDYIPGNLIDLTTLLSSSISVAVLDRMGLNFSLQQEREADKITNVVLESIGRNPKAYSIVLQKVRSYYQGIQDYAGLGKKAEFQAIDQRIIETGAADPSGSLNKSFLAKVSMVVTSNAWIEYYKKHLLVCNELLTRNIGNGTATEDDYLLKAMVINATLNTKESNESALAYLQQAKTLKISPRNVVYKQEGITLMRLNRVEEAKSAFSSYLSGLKEIKDPGEYETNEISWTEKMLFKLDKLAKTS